jgi:hypothetical protein
MDTLSKYEIWYGRDCPPTECVALRAGPLSLEFEEGDLRYIRLGQQELVRRIYVAIRDHNWNTIPGRLTGLKIEAGGDGFDITFDSSHHAGALRFDWHGTISGAADGSITCTMDGAARSDFRYCRIGFCVLHPIRECAGRPYRAQTPQGTVSGELPQLIAPQLVENGLEIPLFPPCSDLTITLASGLEVQTAFEGDLFEMEDQRNWTDGSFKTYCTPISLGYPHKAVVGKACQQRVTIGAVRVPSATRHVCSPTTTDPVTLALGAPLGRSLPSLGFGMAGHGEDLTLQQARLLSQVRPQHLKAELHLGDPQWPAELDRAIRAARQLAASLELAIFLNGDAAAALVTLGDRLIGAPVARLLVFHETEAGLMATRPCWVEMVRRSLGAAFPGITIGGGTNGNFAELNRAWPDTTSMDALSFTINPQVHATDERSLIEALEPQEATIQTARAACGPLPICVSSVTLKPPFNQAATEEEVPPSPDEIPPSVDPRQMSLFAAAWTVGSLRALTAGGAASLTYYETTGWRGLLETDRGSPLPARFRSKPGMVFPVYHVFADLADGGDAEVIAVTASDPLRVTGLALRWEGRLRVLVANLLPSRQRVTVGPLTGGTAAVRRLNEDTAYLAMFEPKRFRELREPLVISHGQADLILGPYEVVRLDARE